MELNVIKESLREKVTKTPVENMAGKQMRQMSSSSSQKGRTEKVRQ